jgi:hypothetical protein
MAVLTITTTALTYGISRFRVPWDVASVVAAAIATERLLSRDIWGVMSEVDDTQPYPVAELMAAPPT